MRLLALAAVCLILAACSSNDDGEATATVTATPQGEDETATSPAATAEPEDTPAEEPTTGPTSTTAVEDAHNAERALEDIDVLAGDIGPRVAGSAAEDAAIEHIAAELAAAGYDVEVIPFTFPGERFPTALIDLDGSTFDALPLNGSAPGEAMGAAVDMGSATPDEVAPADLDGAIAIAHRGEATFREMTLAATEAGAAGLVIVNNEEGPFDGALEVSATIPVIAVGTEVGDLLADAAAEGDAIAVEVSGPIAESANVFARAPGTETCQVIAGAHHDTVPLSPGAHDNASGVANVLELARSFAADGLDDGLCFATFGAEESGLYGSAALAAMLSEEDALPRYMVNFDVTGVGDTISLTGDADLVALAAGLADDEGIDAAPGELPGGSSSDHVSFLDAGVPAVFLFSLDYDTIHTPQDRVEDIDVAELDRAGDLGHALITVLMEGSDVAP